MPNNSFQTSAMLRDYWQKSNWQFKLLLWESPRMSSYNNQVNRYKNITSLVFTILGLLLFVPIYSTLVGEGWTGSQLNYQQSQQDYSPHFLWNTAVKITPQSPHQNVFHLKLEPLLMKCDSAQIGTPLIFKMKEEQNCLLIVGRACVTCSGSKLTNSPGRTKVTNSLGKHQLLPCIWSVHAP